jgi:D-3-phosphoglycerate dehydrogenase
MGDAPRVLIADAVDGKAREILAGEGFDVSYRPEITHDSLLACAGEYAALIVRSRTVVSADVLAAAGTLRVVGRAGAGVDNIDVEEATRRGIVVMNTPGGNTVSTAEHTIAMMLSLARNIPAADRSVRAMEWRRKDFTGTEVSGKTVGLIGLGKVGQEVARKAKGLDMRVLAFDPLVSDEAARKLGVEPAPLPELFRCADFISVHSPLTPETRNLLNIDSMRACKRGVRIINCARGGILNERDLLVALEEGIVAGAALDVFDREPPSDARLVTHPRVVCTPHLGASTEEAQEKVALQIARQIADFLLERNVAGSVNADLIRIGMRRELLPFLGLAEKMGRFMAQIIPEGIGGVRIILKGEIPEDAGEVILAAFLKGLLSALLSESVNYVNAAVLARDRGLDARSVFEQGEGRYGVEVVAECTTQSGRRLLTGTVFGANDVRLTGLDAHHFEIKPEGDLLFYYNLDRPGMLARVSAILSEHGINIGDLSLGRLRPGDRALTVIATDQPPPTEILFELTQIEGISDIHHVRL